MPADADSRLGALPGPEQRNARLRHETCAVWAVEPGERAPAGASAHEPRLMNENLDFRTTQGLQAFSATFSVAAFSTREARAPKRRELSDSPALSLSGETVIKTCSKRSHDVP